MNDRKLRVAVWFNLPAGGARRALSYQISGLLKQGHEVEVWSAPLRDAEHHQLPAGVCHHVLPLEDDYAPDGSRPPAAATPWGRIADFAGFTQRWLETHEDFSRRCAKQINGGNFDVLLAHNCWRLHSPFIGRHVQIPSALYLHEPRRPLYEAVEGSPWLPLSSNEARPSSKARLKDYFDTQGRRLQVAAEAANARSFGRILVNSYFSRESVMRAYGLNSFVCRLGIDTELFHPTNKQKEQVVVSVGHISPIKNPEFLIEAMGRLETKGAELILITHGIDPAYRDRCNRLAAKLGVRIRYEFQVSDTRLVELLGAASAFAFAPYLEPLGLAPLEANACGTAAVAVAEGGPRETIQNEVNGFLVDRDPGAMAAQLDRLLKDREFAVELGQRARFHVEKEWSLPVAEAALEAHLRAVIQSRVAA